MTVTRKPTDPPYRRRPVWPWIALLVVLTLVAWLVFRPERHPIVAEANPIVTDSGLISGPAPVKAYLEFIGDARAATAMAPDHEFVATAIDRLAAALEALAAPRVSGVQRDLDALHAEARALQQQRTSMAHADTARAAFVRLTSLMSAVQAQQFPSHAAEVDRARQAAERLDPDRPLLEQRDAVQRFLDRSADAIRAMAEDERPAVS